MIDGTKTLIKRRQVEIKSTISCSGIYARMDPKSPSYAPTFPRPIRLGNGVNPPKLQPSALEVPNVRNESSAGTCAVQYPSALFAFAASSLALPRFAFVLAGVASGKYPEKVRLGPRTVAWRESDINQLIAEAQ